MRSADELAALMATARVSPVEQINQIRFRTRLVEHWNIPAGARVLEIGCGQGDMTAVLAEAVGPNGSVVAVDLADPGYGSPITIGDSATHMAEGPLGDRIKFRFRFDVRDSTNAFQNDEFDVVVLAHCTWYFDSLGCLKDVLRVVRPWTKRLCLSEWDLQPHSIEQFGHLLAVLIQGQVEAFRTEGNANVRTPYSRETLAAILAETGWNVEREAMIDASDLADARWEIAACLAHSRQDADASGAPPKMRAFIDSQIDVLRRLSVVVIGRPLPSYSIVAVKAPKSGVE
jgi:SAM-dependent methyltransferase